MLTPIFSFLIILNTIEKMVPKKIKFYKTFSTANILVLILILASCLFCLYQILWVEANSKTYLIINSLVCLIPLLLIVIRNTKKDWVQADWYRIQFNLNGKTRTLKRQEIRSITFEENTLEIHWKSGSVLRVDLCNYKSSCKKMFVNLLK